MTDEHALPGGPALPRPTSHGPADDAFYDLVEARVHRLVAADPVVGTYLGLHAHDDALGDGSRDAVLGELASDRTHLTEIEAIEPESLSGPARFDRELELHNVRRDIFDADVVRAVEDRRPHDLSTRSEL